MIVTAGSTNVSVYFYVVQDASGTSPGEPVTGLLFSDIETGGSASYVRQGAARTDLTLVTLASASAAHTDGGFIEVDATNMPGLYRCDFPDAAFATGVDQVFLSIVVASANNAVAAPIKVDITDFDLRTANVTLASGTHTGAVIPTVDTLTGHTAQTGDSFARLGAPTGASIAADIGTAQADLDTITDTDGVILGAAGVDLIWDEVLTGATHDVTNSSGKRLRQIDAAFEVHSGTAQAGGTNTITLDTGASSSDDIYRGDRIVIVGGTGAQEHGICISYDGTTKVATMSENWVITPDATSEFEVVPADVDVETWQHNAATASASGLPDVNVNEVRDTAQTAGDLSSQISTVDTVVDSISAEIGTAGSGLTNINLPDQTMNITGSIDTVNNAVTVGTNNDKTGYTLSQAFPANFSSMVITPGGAVDALVQGFINNLINEVTAGRISNNFDTFFDNADTDTTRVVDDVGGAGGSADWTASERNEIRGRLGITGTTAIGGNTPTLALESTVNTRMPITHINATAGKVDGVALVDTASTVTDGAKASVATEARLSELDQATPGKMANQVDIIQTDTTTDIPAQISGLNNVAATDIVSNGPINTLAGAVVNVDTVDVTTTNSDMVSSAPTASQIADAVLDEVLSGHVVAGSLGAAIKDILDDTNELQADDIPGLVSALNNLSDAQVLTKVNEALDAAIPELGIGVPTATPSIRTALMLLYMIKRNKLDVQTSGTDSLEIHNDAGTLITQKLLTDDGTDYSEAKMS